MKSLDMTPFYQFSAKGLRSPSGFKKHVDHAVSEILEALGNETDLHVHIEPEAKSRGLFTLTMSADVSGEPVTIKKTGRHIHALLKKSKKVLIKMSRHAKKGKNQARGLSSWQVNAMLSREAS